mmetsp:Transcript_1402/g.3190  ORF Transcript_1402/g.3190 Transcript_1402/m.3190 type:complete len:94 (-) Transcript_1402:1805-2086(-)
MSSAGSRPAANSLVCDYNALKQASNNSLFELTNTTATDTLADIKIAAQLILGECVPRGSRSERGANKKKVLRQAPKFDTKFRAPSGLGTGTFF